MKRLLILVTLLLITNLTYAGSALLGPCEKQGLTSGSASDILTVTVPENASGGGKLIYCTYAINATDTIVNCTSQNFTITNRAGADALGTLGAADAAAEDSPGTQAVSSSLSQTRTATTIVLRATPTVANFSADTITFSIHYSLPSAGNISVQCN